MGVVVPLASLLNPVVLTLIRMFSDSEEEKHCISFSTEGEYENGEWINNEFYASEKKRSRGQTKEEALYGIWAETGNSSDDERLKKRRTIKSSANALSGIGFVSASKNQLKKNTSQKTPPQTTAPPVVGVGKRKSNQEFAELFKKEKEEKPTVENVPVSSTDTMEPKRVLPTVNVDKLGSWQKHTKGFGSKMLMKMGFKGRLGKEEQGISAPVAVRVRPTQMGLGFGDFKEATTLKQNKEIERDLHGTDDKQSSEEETTEETLEREDQGLWRKRAKVNKRKYVSANDVLRNKDSCGINLNSKQVVMDMRGPEVKVLDNLHNISTKNEPVMDGKPKLGQELIYNVSMIVSSSEMKLLDLSQKARGSQEKLRKFESEGSTMQNRLTSMIEERSNLQSLLVILKDLKRKVGSDLDQYSLHDIIDVLVPLKSNFNQEFKMYRLDTMMPSILLPFLQREVNNWKPLSSPISSQILSSLVAVKKLLFLEGTTRNNDNYQPVFGKNHYEQKTTYDYIINQVLIPRVTSAITNSWDVHNPSSCILLVDSLNEVVSSTIVDEKILKFLILPRLQFACERWNPLKDEVHIYAFIAPWRKYFSSEMPKLYTQIRSTLGTSLSKWHPKDYSIYEVLEPWEKEWGKVDYAKFTHRYVVPRLARMVKKEVVINPKYQELEAVTWLVSSKKILPLKQFVALFDGEFFPKWISCLRQWIQSDTVNRDELLLWFTGWENLLLRDLGYDSIFIKRFYNALELINAKLSGMDIPQDPLNAVQSYSDALALNSVKVEANVEAGQASKEMEYSFKEVVIHFAAENNVELLPRGRKDGKVVFSFDGRNIIIDGDIVLAEDVASKGQYHPIDLEELLNR